MAPGARGQALLPACHSPCKAVAHGYSLEMLDDKGRVCDLLGDVRNHQCPGDLGEEAKGCEEWICRMGRDLQDILLPPCPPSSELGCHPRGQSDLLNAQSQTLRAQPDNAIRQTDGCSRASVSRDMIAREIDLPPGCHFIQKLVKISHTFPCQPSSRLFLKPSVPTGTSICAKQEVH